MATESTGFGMASTALVSDEQTQPTHYASDAQQELHSASEGAQYSQHSTRAHSAAAAVYWWLRTSTTGAVTLFNGGICLQPEGEQGATVTQGQMYYQPVQTNFAPGTSDPANQYGGGSYFDGQPAPHGSDSMTMMVAVVGEKIRPLLQLVVRMTERAKRLKNQEQG